MIGILGLLGLYGGDLCWMLVMMFMGVVSRPKMMPRVAQYAWRKAAQDGNRNPMAMNAARSDMKRRFLLTCQKMMPRRAKHSPEMPTTGWPLRKMVGKETAMA